MFPFHMRGKPDIKSNKGFSLIELIVAMALMGLLASSLFTLISYGGNSYTTIQGKNKAMNEARLAISYITVKIRQNDGTGSDGKRRISVDAASETLTIKKEAPSDGKYVIRAQDGIIYEDDYSDATSCNTSEIAGRPYQGDPGILQMDFKLDVNDTVSNNTIPVTIYYPGGSLEETVLLRSDTK